MNIFTTQFLQKEGLVILLLTVMSYGVALSYELGYAIYFSFDTEFIQIDIKAIYNGLISVSAYFLVALVLLTVFKQTQSSDNQKLIQVIVYVFLIGSLSTPPIPKIILGNIVTTIVICFGMSIFYISYYYLANKDRLSLPILVGIACLFIISMSTVIGISRAASETGINVFKWNDAEYGIIRIYNGNIIAIKVEDNKLSHTQKIYIPGSEVKSLETRTLWIQAKPGLTNYKQEYPAFPKNSLGDIYLKDKDVAKP